MSFDRAHEAVSSLASQVHTQLAAHRATGGSDAEFLDEWVPVFVAQARQTPGPAVLIHMAVALFDLSLARDEITRLADLVAMHEEWLSLLPE